MFVLPRTDVQVDWLNVETLQSQDFPWGRLHTNEAARKKLPRFNQINPNSKDNEVYLLCPVEGNFNFHGSKNTVIVGGIENKMSRISLNFWGRGAWFVLGPGSSCNNFAAEFIHEDVVAIGRDCMFSTEVVFRPNDMHVILDETGTVINGSKPIVVRDHVWIGQRVMVLKGVEIGSGCIVGSGSVVTKAFPAACAVGGSPAKIIRRKVSWTRSRAPTAAEKADAISYITAAAADES